MQLCTLSYGKVKLVLKHSRFYVESTFSEVIQRLIKDPDIMRCGVRREEAGDELITGSISTGPTLPAKRAPPKREIPLPLLPGRSPTWRR